MLCELSDKLCNFTPYPARRANSIVATRALSQLVAYRRIKAFQPTRLLTYTDYVVYGIVHVGVE